MPNVRFLIGLLALSASSACDGAGVVAQSGTTTNRYADVPIADTSSPSAIYLKCTTDDERSAEPVKTYRIDPLIKTWSWWNEDQDDLGPKWEVFECSDKNRGCTFEDTVFEYSWSESRAGSLVSSRQTVNRATGTMEIQRYTDSNGLLFWEYQCEPTDNPANALGKKF